MKARAGWLLVLWMAGGAGVVRAQTAQPPAPAPAPAPAAAPAPAPAPDDPRQKLEAVERQIEDLEQKKQELEQQAEAAERLANRKQELAELHANMQERINDWDARLAELKAEEPPEKPARRALLNARIEQLKARRVVAEEVLGLQDVAQLDKARETARRLEALDREWDMLGECELEFAATLEELTEHLAEHDSPARREAFEKLKRAQAEELADRKQILALEQSRETRERQMDELQHALWGE